MITIPKYIEQHIHNCDGKVTKAMFSIDGFEGLTLNVNSNTPVTLVYKGCTFNIDYQGFINWVNNHKNNP